MKKGALVRILYKQRFNTLEYWYGTVVGEVNYMSGGPAVDVATVAITEPNRIYRMLLKNLYHANNIERLLYF